VSAPTKTSVSWLAAHPIAHRGLHDRASGVIENSTAAFMAAVGSNYAMECDVQLTRDGEAVVFHDFTLDRLTDDAGRVVDRTAADLAGIALTDSQTSDTIRSFRDLLDRVAGRAPIICEIKSAFDGDLRLVRRVVETLAGRDAPVALKSFDPRVVAALRMMAPHIPRGIIAMSDYDYPDYEALPPAEKHAMANLLHFSQMEPDFLSWRVKDLPSGLPYLCRTQLGLPVMTWTVRTPEDAALAGQHADQMVFEGFRP
jgi:glycerophosphoryl diester phosphodiesterase